MSHQDPGHHLCGQPGGFSELEKHLLNDFQRDFPLTSAPYADIARQLEVSEQEVLEALQRLSERETVSRIGAVIAPNSIGASTLAAMSVPQERLGQVAEIISSFVEVNHNYEREHDINLWFVVTAADEEHLQQVLKKMEQQTGLSVLNLPMLEDFHIDLGFELQWV